MTYQKFETPSEALKHYGVKGQRWGVRKERETSGSKGQVGVDPVTVAIGLTYLTAVIAPIAYALTLNHLEKKEVKRGEEHAKKTQHIPFKRKPSLKEAKTVEEIESQVVKQVNPKYGEKGTKMNCRRCTFAYEMRRRGYDVEATRSKYAATQDQHGLSKATKQHGGKKPESLWGEKEIGSYDAMRVKTGMERSQHVFDHLSKEPDGSRGELAVGWFMGGGHSMAYEVVQGKPVIFDAQSGQTFKDAGSFHKSKMPDVMYEAAITRTDNKPLDEQWLRRWVTNVES